MEKAVADSCGDVLCSSGGICYTPVRSLSADAGGWLSSDLLARGRVRLFRGHVPPVQSSEVQAIIVQQANGNSYGLRPVSSFSTSRLNCFLDISPALCNRVACCSSSLCGSGSPLLGKSNF